MYMYTSIYICVYICISEKWEKIHINETHEREKVREREKALMDSSKRDM